jgi:hypothetical protein
LLPIMPTGVALAAGSKVDPKQIGKIPGRYCGNGTWSGLSWRSKEGPHVATEGEIALWETWPDNPRVGLIGTEFKAIDADVTDPVLNGKIKELAFAILGRVSCRIGSPPKFLLMYRLPGGLLKMQLKFTNAAGYCAGMVEVLGHRQQWVVDGVHPGTQRPYYYEGPHPIEVGADLWPETTVEKIEAFVTAVVTAAELFGYAVHIPGRSKAEPGGIKLHRGKSDTPAADGPPEEELDWDAPETIAWAPGIIADELTKEGVPKQGAGSDDRVYRLAGKLKDGPRWGSALQDETIARLLHRHWAPHFTYDWLLEKVERTHANGRGCGQIGSASRTFGGTYANAQGEPTAPEDEHARVRREYLPQTSGSTRKGLGNPKMMSEYISNTSATAPRQDLVPDFIEAGWIVPITAPGGFHKSRVILQIYFAKMSDRPLFAYSVTGRNFSEQAPCGGIDVPNFAVIAYEGNDASRQGRIDRMKQWFRLPEGYPDAAFYTPDEPLMTVSDQGAMYITDAGCELILLLEKNEGHTLLWFDSFFDTIEMSTTARVNDGIARRVIHTINTRWCQRLDCTILTPFHPSRGGDNRGDTGYAPAFEDKSPQVLQILNVQRKVQGGRPNQYEKTNEYVLKVKKWNEGPEAVRVPFRYDRGQLISINDGEISDAGLAARC